MPEQSWEPRRYRITAECTRCGNTFSWVSTKLDGKNRPCPKRACREAIAAEQRVLEQANFAKMVEEQRAPSHIGDKPMVKAIDTTAEIVMQDHGMTDLKDNIRPGETMAPKLPGKQQQLADGYFGGKAALSHIGIKPQQAALLGRRAMAGAFRHNAINPTEIIGAKRGEPVLRQIGTEKLKSS